MRRAGTEIYVLFEQRSQFVEGLRRCSPHGFRQRKRVLFIVVGEQIDLNDREFCDELDSVINTIRKDGLLKNRRNM